MGYLRVQVIEKLNVSLYLKVVGWNLSAAKLNEILISS